MHTPSLITHHHGSSHRHFSRIEPAANIPEYRIRCSENGMDWEEIAPLYHDEQIDTEALYAQACQRCRAARDWDNYWVSVILPGQWLGMSRQCPQLPAQ